jgi:5-formyltetrahydrofolate cyclo-ligase
VKDATQTSRNELRRTLRAQRRALSVSEQEQAAARAAIHLSGTRRFRSAKHVAVYLASDGEIDTWPIIERCREFGKTVYLPVLRHLGGDRLWFVPFRSDTPLTLNRFGIPEPVPAPRELFDARDLDLVVMPLVGFDVLGNRLGMGGGFYDRSLAFLRHRNSWIKPRLIGLAHELQRVEQLDHKEWDVPLDAVVTDTTVYRFELDI